MEQFQPDQEKFPPDPFAPPQSLSNSAVPNNTRQYNYKIIADALKSYDTVEGLALAVETYLEKKFPERILEGSDIQYFQGYLNSILDLTKAVLCPQRESIICSCLHLACNSHDIFQECSPAQADSCLNAFASGLLSLKKAFQELTPLHVDSALNSLAIVSDYFKQPQEFVETLDRMGSDRVCYDQSKLQVLAERTGIANSRPLMACLIMFTVDLNPGAVIIDEFSNIIKNVHYEKIADTLIPHARMYLADVPPNERLARCQSFVNQRIACLNASEKQDFVDVLHRVVEQSGADFKVTGIFLAAYFRIPEENRLPFLLKCDAISKFGLSFFCYESSFVEYFFKTNVMSRNEEQLGLKKRLAIGASRYLSRVNAAVTAASKLVEFITRRYDIASDNFYGAKIASMLDGSTILAHQRISSPDVLTKELLQLEAHHSVLEILYNTHGPSTDILKKNYAKNFNGDNPPFSLDKTPDHVQTQFVSEIHTTMRRMFDGAYGFNTRTFAMRRSPLTGKSYFDESMENIGAHNKIIWASDYDQFPGRGRLVSGIKKQNIFAPLPIRVGDKFSKWKNDILQSLGPVADSMAGGNTHALDDLHNCTFVLARGFHGLIVSDNPFFNIFGEPASYIEYNPQQDPSGFTVAALVPSRVLWTFLQPHVFTAGDEKMSLDNAGISSDPPTLNALRSRCREMGTKFGVVNLGSGSNFMGGLCNGFDPRSEPFHVWERTKMMYIDGFGHPHKYNIQGDYHELSSLHGAHRRVYEIVTAATRRLDLFKVIECLTAWGEGTKNRSGSDGSENETQIGGLDFDPENTRPENKGQQLSMVNPQDVDDFSEDSETVRESWNRRSERMLEWAALQMFECRASKVPVNHCPLLVLRPALEQSVKPQTPFILDTANGIIWRQGNKPLLFSKTDGTIPPDIKNWWDKDIAPYSYRGDWLAPQLVSREWYKDELEKLKGQAL